MSSYYWLRRAYEYPVSAWLTGTRSPPILLHR